MTNWLMGIAMLALFGAATAKQPLHLGVIGAGGHVGQRIVDEALERGHRVRAIVRDPTRYARRHEYLDVVQGDATDATSLQAAAAGLDVLVNAAGTGRVAEADGSLYLKAAQALERALHALPDAPRLIVVGGVGSLLDAAGAPVLDKVPPERRGEHLGQQAALEYYRASSGLRWTYASPPARFMPGERTGRYRIGGDRLLVDDQGVRTISMEDYAVALVDEAERGEHVGRRIGIAW
jgi:putative NADH-flavin reductase